MNRFRFPDPPHTHGLRGPDWPEASDLSPKGLDAALYRTRGADHVARMDPSRHSERMRMALNICCQELFEEAVRRGMIDPYAEPVRGRSDSHRRPHG